MWTGWNQKCRCLTSPQQLSGCIVCMCLCVYKVRERERERNNISFSCLRRKNFTLEEHLHQFSSARRFTWDHHPSHHRCHRHHYLCVSGSGGKVHEGYTCIHPFHSVLGVVIWKPWQPYNYRDVVWTPYSANNCSLFAKPSPRHEMSKQTSRGCEEKKGRIIIMIYECTTLQAIYWQKFSSSPAVTSIV